MTLDPRIAWQRGLLRDDRLDRNARTVGLAVGAVLGHGMTASVGVAQLVEWTGFGETAVRNGLRKLRAARWLTVAQRGYRGRVSTYRAESLGLLGRSDVPASEYRHSGDATSPEYRHSGDATSPEYRHSSDASQPNSATPVTASRTYEELRTYVETPDPREPATPAQAPAVAVVVDPDVGAVLEGLPAALAPLTPRDRARMAQLIGQRLAAGWSAPQLVAATADLGAVAVRNRPSFWAALVDQAPPPPPPAPYQRPAWCGECDEPTRMVEVDDGRLARCPDCHPLAAAGVR